MIHSIITKSSVLKKAKVVSLAKLTNSSSKISFQSTMLKIGLAWMMISLEEWPLEEEIGVLDHPPCPFNLQFHPKIRKIVIIIAALV